jgi:non-heme chloroperoxidase
MSVTYGLVVALCASVVLSGQKSWRDPSPHRTQLVSVEDGVQLEVLDWGGTGRPIVLLAGYTTAHIFDDIAPKLARVNQIMVIQLVNLVRT